MEQRFIDYQRARQAVLVAQKTDGRPGLDAAYEQLRVAEQAVAAEVAVAWDINVAAVAAARTVVVQARREETRIQIEAADAARTRNPLRPVLTTEELDRCHAAEAVTRAAQAALVAAETAFKAGVTAEQAEAVA